MIYNNVDLNALKIFVAVYENKGIDKASKKLFISQPAVSIAIKKLEEKLNGKLFVRLPKGIKPTEEGDKFYNECKTAIDKLNCAFVNFTKENALREGFLKIGASTSVIKHILMPVLKNFCKKHPNIKVSFTEVIASRLERYLVNGDIDVAFMEEPIDNIKLYRAEKISSLNSCFIAGVNFKDDYITKKDMQNYSYAVLKKNTNNRECFDALCLQNGLNLKVIYEMASFETLQEICEHNLAIGFTIEEFMGGELQNAKIKQIKTDIALPKIDVYALLPKSGTSGYVCENFLGYFKKNSV